MESRLILFKSLSEDEWIELLSDKSIEKFYLYAERKDTATELTLYSKKESELDNLMRLTFDIEDTPKIFYDAFRDKKDNLIQQWFDDYIEGGERIFGRLPTVKFDNLFANIIYNTDVIYDEPIVKEYKTFPTEDEMILSDIRYYKSIVSGKDLYGNDIDHVELKVVRESDEENSWVLININIIYKGGTVKEHSCNCWSNTAKKRHIDIEPYLANKDDKAVRQYLIDNIWVAYGYNPGKEYTEAYTEFVNKAKVVWSI